MRDCSAAVLDGVWPYELMTPRKETEMIARYLRDDLDKIVSRTNERLAEMDSWRHLPSEQRMAEETRVINVARALAVLRVESTVRSLGGRAITVSPHVVEVTRAIEADLMSRPGQAERSDSSAGRRSGPGAPRGGARRPAPGPPPRGAAPRPEPQPRGAWPPPPRPQAPPPQGPPSQPEFAPRPAARRLAAEDDEYTAARNSEPVSGPVVIDDEFTVLRSSEPVSGPVVIEAEDVTTEVPRDVVGEAAAVEQAPAAAPPPDSERRSEPDFEETTSAVARSDVAPPPHGGGRSEPTFEETTMVVGRGDFVAPAPAPPAAASRDFVPPAPPRPAPPPRSPRPAAAPRGHVEGRPVMAGPDQLQEWLEQVVGILARQQPALKWVVGERGDGSIVVATDVASGWIPPGVVLPAGVVALEPERRSGRLEDWVGQVERGARYEPGDRIPPSSVPAGLVEKPFAVVEVPEDLGWQLGEATRLHEGLPRIAHTLAKAGAARTGVPEAEMDVLAVQVETMVQSMLAAYPGVSEQGAVSCMLIGAAEAMAAGRTVLAAYHYAWYETFAGRRWE